MNDRRTDRLIAFGITNIGNSIVYMQKTIIDLRTTCFTVEVSCVQMRVNKMEVLSLRDRSIEKLIIFKITSINKTFYEYEMNINITSNMFYRTSRFDIYLNKFHGMASLETKNKYNKWWFQSNNSFRWGRILEGLILVALESST